MARQQGGNLRKSGQESIAQSILMRLQATRTVNCNVTWAGPVFLLDHAMNCQTKTDEVSNFRITNSWSYVREKERTGQMWLSAKKKQYSDQSWHTRSECQQPKERKGSLWKIHITKSDKAWHMKKPWFCFSGEVQHLVHKTRKRTLVKARSSVSYSDGNNWFP